MSISLSHFTLKAEEALLKAQQMAAEGRQAKVEPEHLLLSLLEQNDPMIEFCFRLEISQKIRRIQGKPSFQDLFTGSF
jgi:ATP-dependent Clp protease ATP-binding subunit ClpA